MERLGRITTSLPGPAHRPAHDIRGHAPRHHRTARNRIQRHTAGRTMGCYDNENHVILIDRRLTYTAKRCTLVHELLHWRHGDTGCSNNSSKLERRARTQTALTLVNPAELALLERMYEYEWQIADELNVTTQVLEDYRRTITPA